jgi:hypothetical protein
MAAPEELEAARPGGAEAGRGGAGSAGEGAVAAVPTFSAPEPAGCRGAPQRMQKFALGTLAN